MPNDIVPVEGQDLISQFPAQFQQIVLQLLSHCASNAFPTTDNQPGRFAFMLEGPGTPATFTDGGPMRGCVFAFKGTTVGGAPIWVRLLNINDPPATASALLAVKNAKQNVITGAATTITGANLTPARVVGSDSNGKIAVGSTNIYTLDAAMVNFDYSRGNAQAQIDSKQPRIYYSTAVPTSGDATGKADGTLWIQYA